MLAVLRHSEELLHCGGRDLGLLVGVALLHQVAGYLSTDTRDLALQAPSWLYPWERQPEGLDGGVPLDKVLEAPVLGPGSISPSAVPNPYDMSGGVSVRAPCTDLAGALSWATPSPL